MSTSSSPIHLQPPEPHTEKEADRTSDAHSELEETNERHVAALTASLREATDRIRNLEEEHTTHTLNVAAEVGSVMPDLC